MKLRNKRTGEIGYLIAGKGSDHYVVTNNEWCSCGEYNSLAKLNTEWEDAPEEPKEHWCITMYGGITRIKDDEEPIDDLIEIGNYFNSKEDAYDAWDKLKAWKRLKSHDLSISKGNRTFVNTDDVFVVQNVQFRIDMYGDAEEDLDLLFCTEVKNDT